MISQVSASATGLYLIENDRLYVKDPDSVIPNHLIDNKRAVSFGSKGDYFLAKQNYDYFKDCLETAEDLINDKYPRSLRHEVRSRTVVTNRPFGNTQKENQSLAGEIEYRNKDKANSFANPVLNEAYVIVSMDERNRYPYHAAAVIAVDSDTRITHEVFACSDDAHRRTEKGSYFIYSITGKEAPLFHNSYKKEFKHGDPITITIKKS